MRARTRVTHVTGASHASSRSRTSTRARLSASGVSRTSSGTSDADDDDVRFRRAYATRFRPLGSGFVARSCGVT